MTDEPLASVEAVHDDAGVLVLVRGEVDLTNADQVAAEVDDALVGERVMRLHLDAVEYLDSHALRVVQRLVDRHVSGSIELTIVAAPEGVAGRLLAMAAVDTQVPVVPPG